MSLAGPDVSVVDRKDEAVIGLQQYIILKQIFLLEVYCLRFFTAFLCLPPRPSLSQCREP